MRRLFLACLVPSLACTDFGSTPAVDAGGDDGSDAAIPCPGAGISKGPWVLAIDETSAKVRWEACRPQGSRAVSFATESGGQSSTAVPLETSTFIPETYTAPLNPNAVPDYSGTWYTEEASLSGLTADTCYTYSLAADATRAGRFCTARASGSPIRFLAIGDTNPALGDSTTNVLAHVLPKKPDFSIHLGDIQYYDSTLETWALWAMKMQPLLSAGGFLPSIGNHEAEKPDELVNYTLRYFHGAGFAGNDEYYRFESGGVYFFVLDTELPTDGTSDQAKWLVAGLAEVSKKPGFRFSVVYFHKPFVTCGDSGLGDNPAARAYLEPIFKQYTVPLVLQAHMHGYERFEFPGITYVTTAGGGGVLGDINKEIAHPYCGQRVASGAFFHGLVVDVTTGKLGAQAIDDQGAVRDSFEKVVP